MIVRTANTACHHAPGCPHDLGPASPAPLRGHSHRGHEVPGGSFARPLPAPEPPEQARREQLAEAQRRLRARRRAEA